MTLDADEILWNGRSLSGFDRVWIQGFSYLNPVVPDAALQRDWSVWQMDSVTGQQEYSALYSVFEELDRRGVTLFNPPRVHLKNFTKFSWLEALRDAGYQVPALFCSNDAQEVKLFCQQWTNVVWRPAIGRGAWQIFMEKQSFDLVAPHKPPILLAEGKMGFLTHAWLLNGKVVLCLRKSPPQHTPPLERLEFMLPVDLGDQLEVLQRLVLEQGVAWAMVTFIPSDTGPWIYDLDPDPILDWLPVVFRDVLLFSLASVLTGQEPRCAAPVAGQERPNMFLRRMLKILFELEYSKYSQR
ncbi:MAG: hypothetical protein HQL84_08495 [Magnetococcales bacterium]|nr:hypothetical protein [Magnetococcales bacterium]MBF0150069.1 hypothetical protein [Magnetococcales bacterium]